MLEPRGWAWIQSAPEPAAKLVLLALAEKADATGVSIVPQTELESITGINARPLRAHISRLELDGLLVKRRLRTGGPRPTTSNAYMLCLERPGRVTDEAQALLDDLRAKRRD